MKVENPMKLLFHPRTIAVIGASDDLSRIGGLPLRFLRQHGYGGKIFPVNPRYQEIAGLPCFPSLTDISEPVDLALIAVPRKFVREAFQQCAGKKVPYAILFSAGYAEMGREGKKEQEELGKFVHETGIRVVGPNCNGIINTHGHVATSFTTGLEIDSLVPGAVGLITQSGGIGNCIFTRGIDRSIGLSYFISSGNELDLEVSDFLEYFIQDEATRSIALLLEDLKNPRKFSCVADQAFRAGKPIVVLKVGRSEKGREAAASHTGAMSGADTYYDGLFRQKGISRVFDIDDLIEVSHLFSCYKPPAGNRIAILTSSGGSGALMADLASDHQLRLPHPSARARDQLHDVIPAVAEIANPMDITTQFMNNPDVIARYLRVFAEDENFDVLIITFTTSTPDTTLRLAEKIAATAPSLPKPLVVCWPVGNMARPAFHCLERAGIPLFFHPSRCLSAVGHFTRYAIHQKTHV
ncbi:MAG: CoA-binding protein [Deltaproteobacteria bacterium]|nr:CoA-binding protein [Deltaproteobacteria bacterium]